MVPQVILKKVSCVIMTYTRLMVVMQLETVGLWMLKCCRSVPIHLTSVSIICTRSGEQQGRLELWSCGFWRRDHLTSWWLQQFWAEAYLQDNLRLLDASRHLQFWKSLIRWWLPHSRAMKNLQWLHLIIAFRG